MSVIKDTLQRKRQSKPTEKLNDQIHSQASSQDYLLEHNKPNVNLNFIPANEIYINNIINKLKNKSSCGYDNYSNKHIKYVHIFFC